MDSNSAGRVQEENGKTKKRGIVRRLYDWVLHWAETRYGSAALFVNALAESSFFPIPPDPLLIALCIGQPRKALRFAFWCSLASVLGGIIGYWIGSALWAVVGDWFYRWVPSFTPQSFEHVRALYDRYDFWVVFTAGFSPIPYKLITIGAGVFAVNFPVFIVASVISRSARFFMVALLIRRFGPPIRDFIDRYFNLLSVVFVVLLVGGFMLFKYVLR